RASGAAGGHRQRDVRPPGGRAPSGDLPQPVPQKQGADFRPDPGRGRRLPPDRIPGLRGGRRACLLHIGRRRPNTIPKAGRIPHPTWLWDGAPSAARSGEISHRARTPAQLRENTGYGRDPRFGTRGEGAMIFLPQAEVLQALKKCKRLAKQDLLASAHTSNPDFWRSQAEARRATYDRLMGLVESEGVEAAYRMAVDEHAALPLVDSP